MSLFGIMQDQEYHSHLHAPPPNLPQDRQQQNMTVDATATATTDPQRPSNGNEHGSGSGDNTASDGTGSNDNNNNGNNNGRNHNRHVRSRHRTTTTTTTINSSAKTTKSKYTRPGTPGRPKHAALLELLYGIILYATCIFLPSFPRYVYQLYVWSTTWLSIIRERILWSIWICWRFSLVILERFGRVVEDRQNNNTDEEILTTAGMTEDESPSMRRFGRRISKYIFSTSTASLWEEFNEQQQQNEGRQHYPSKESSLYTWGYGRTASSFPAILMVLQDIQILLILAVILAIIRVWFVYMLVPEYLVPQRLEAMTRCKSSHLLSSSSYSFGGVKGWDGAAEQAGVRRESLSGRCSVDQSVANSNREGRAARGWYERMLMWVTSHWYRLRPSVRRSLGFEPSARYNDILINQPSPHLQSNSSAPNPTQHLFSAPRHATATFRLLYTSISCISALILFQSAEFWPRPLLGTHPRASTKHCWDLSGSFSALGDLDGGYDARNGALKYFFLAQAAYQLHSLCFHIVSMLLLMMYGGDNNNAKVANNKPRKLISMKTSMQSYARPMMEHVIVLALLVGAYLFSGLRRLGAVGIFTLELSSVFLQLLQVCIYAPENSWWRKPEVVLFVHRMLTVPTFVYCRLIVLPFVLWRSALFESQEWLEQIEKVFSPGCSESLYAMFNASLCLIFALNLVLFRRLLSHPHLKQVVKQQKRDHGY